MPSSIFAGEFEQLVLLAVLRAGEEAAALRLREELRVAMGRSVSRGAIYRTLDRLVAKKLLSWNLEPADTPERGGHPRRRFTVTPRGMAVLRDARAAVLRLSEGMEEVFG
jgi:PadR family transcriptional regulator